MTDRLHNTLNRWLGFEEQNEQAAADAELFRLFRLIPPPEPSVQFIDRVMERSGIARQAEFVYSRPLRIALKAVLCLALLLSALTVAVVPSVVIPLAKRLNPMKLLDFSVDMTVELVRRIAESVAVWRALAGLGETMSQLVESPVGIAALTMGFILSAGALRAISVLIASDQRGRYVSFV